MKTMVMSVCLAAQFLALVMCFLSDFKVGSLFWWTAIIPAAAFINILWREELQ